MGNDTIDALMAAGLGPLGRIGFDWREWIDRQYVSSVAGRLSSFAPIVTHEWTTTDLWVFKGAASFHILALYRCERLFHYSGPRIDGRNLYPTCRL